VPGMAAAGAAVTPAASRPASTADEARKAGRAPVTNVHRRTRPCPGRRCSKRSLCDEPI
jgi:hypothetical protein